MPFIDACQIILSNKLSKIIGFKEFLQTPPLHGSGSHVYSYQEFTLLFEHYPSTALDLSYQNLYELFEHSLKAFGSQQVQ